MEFMVASWQSRMKTEGGQSGSSGAEIYLITQQQAKQNGGIRCPVAFGV